jgi:hypothetical protein
MVHSMRESDAAFVGDSTWEVEMQEVWERGMNLERVTQAIVDSGIGPVAAEEGARLVAAFIDAAPRFPDTGWKTLAVEVPWYMMLRPKTLVVGVMDRIPIDPDGNIWGCEWKSRKEPRMTKAGVPYKGDSEQDWLAEISSGQQVRIYALAMRRAHFVWEDKLSSTLWDGAQLPRLIVRAVVKAVPAYVWPTRPEDGQFTFPEPYLDATEAALVNAAEAIRAARKTGLVPHSLLGLHCINKYNRLCDFHEPFCSKGLHPIGETWTSPNSTDPGWKAIEASGADLSDPDVVVLSASSYGTWAQCPEQYRILVAGLGAPQESMALDVGTGLHSGVAQFFREQKE